MTGMQIRCAQMIPQTVSWILWQEDGFPAGVDDATGTCLFCKQDGIGERFEDWLEDNTELWEKIEDWLWEKIEDWLEDNTELWEKIEERYFDLFSITTGRFICPACQFCITDGIPIELLGMKFVGELSYEGRVTAFLFSDNGENCNGCCSSGRKVDAIEIGNGLFFFPIRYRGEKAVKE